MMNSEEVLSSSSSSENSSSESNSSESSSSDEQEEKKTSFLGKRKGSFSSEKEGSKKQHTSKEEIEETSSNKDVIPSGLITDFFKPKNPTAPILPVQSLPPTSMLTGISTHGIHELWKKHTELSIEAYESTLLLEYAPEELKIFYKAVAQYVTALAVGLYGVKSDMLTRKKTFKENLSDTGNILFALVGTALVMSFTYGTAAVVLPAVIGFISYGWDRVIGGYLDQKVKDQMIRKLNFLGIGFEGADAMGRHIALTATYCYQNTVLRCKDTKDVVALAENLCRHLFESLLFKNDKNNFKKKLASIIGKVRESLGMEGKEHVTLRNVNDPIGEDIDCKAMEIFSETGICYVADHQLHYIDTKKSHQLGYRYYKQPLNVYYSKIIRTDNNNSAAEEIDGKIIQELIGEHKYLLSDERKENEKNILLLVKEGKFYDSRYIEKSHKVENEFDVMRELFNVIASLQFSNQQLLEDQDELKEQIISLKVKIKQLTRKPTTELKEEELSGFSPHM